MTGAGRGRRRGRRPSPPPTLRGRGANYWGGAPRQRPPGAQPSLARDAVNGANLYRRNIPRRMARPRRDAIGHVPVQLIVPRGDRHISQSYYELAERYAPGLRRLTVDGSHWLPRTEP